MRVCSNCSTPKPITEFYIRRETGKLRAHCKTCWAERSAVYYSENKARHLLASRKYALKKLYNLTLEQYQTLCIEHEHCCSICHRESALVVDHDHVTGKVRGLLCKKCNTGLGLFNDDWSILSSAMNYLERTTDV